MRGTFSPGWNNFAVKFARKKNIADKFAQEKHLSKINFAE
jgi:hypothetical protein